MLDDFDAVLDEQVFYAEPEPQPTRSRLNDRERLRGVRDTPEVWEYGRGRGPGRHLTIASRHRDPLVGRMLDLRKAGPRELRRQIDLLKYGKQGMRVARLKRKPTLTEEQQAEVDAFDAALGELHEQWRSFK